MHVARIVRTGVWDALPEADGGWTIFTTGRPLIRVRLIVKVRGGKKKHPHWKIVGHGSSGSSGFGWESLEQHIEYHCQHGRGAA
jgi:hypothetical protein